MEFNSKLHNKARQRGITCPSSHLPLAAGLLLGVIKIPICSHRLSDQLVGCPVHTLLPEDPGFLTSHLLWVWDEKTTQTPAVALDFLPTREEYPSPWPASFLTGASTALKGTKSCKDCCFPNISFLFQYISIILNTSPHYLPQISLVTVSNCTFHAALIQLLQKKNLHLLMLALLAFHISFQLCLLACSHWPLKTGW